MNISPHAPTLSMPTVVNPPTESLRRENHQREIITQVSAASHSAAEKGVASEKERARTPAQTNEQVDFANLRKHAEHEASAINEKNHQEHSQQKQDNKEKQEHSGQENSETTADDHQQAKDEQIINELEHRDHEVRTHELAHASIGGSATGSPSYTFEVGPDGKKYAVGGEVSVDLSSVPGDPQATIAKMQKVHAAALAPANPSSQDTRVAATAAQIILQAQSEIMAEFDGEPQKSNVSASSSFAKSSTTLDESSANNIADDFDSLINQTLAAQEEIAPSTTTHEPLASSINFAADSATNAGTTQQSTEVLQRAKRVESFYHNITQAYEKPANYQFELTA